MPLGSFNRIVRIPVENSRTLRNIEVHAQQYLDKSYKGRCYQGVFVLGVRVSDTNALVNSNAPCAIRGLDCIAHVDVECVFSYYKLVAPVPLLGGRVIAKHDSASVVNVQFTRQLPGTDISLIVRTPLNLSGNPLLNTIKVGDTIAGIADKTEHTPMKDHIYVSLTMLTPQAGPSGPLFAHPDLTAALTYLRQLWEQHQRALEARADQTNSYKLLAGNFAAAAWLPRDRVLTRTADTKVLELASSAATSFTLPDEPGYYYYDAHDFSNIRLYRSPKPLPAKKDIPVADALALILSIQENVVNLLQALQ